MTEFLLASLAVLPISFISVLAMVWAMKKFGILH
jgi:hypothetical protein